MLKNYFRIAWRNLKANKFYSIVNISGLGVGLATGIMLLLWVKNDRQVFATCRSSDFHFQVYVTTGNW